MSIIKSKYLNILIIFILVLFTSGCSKEEKDGLYQLQNQSYSQMMSYVIQYNDLTIVVDGGTQEDEENLIKTIKEVSLDNTVDYWLITHYHIDHSGALAKYLNSGSKEINIGKIYYNFPDMDWVKQYDGGCLWELEEITKGFTLYDGEEVVSNQMILLDEDIRIEVIRTFNSQITENAGNNSSSVYRLDINNNSYLFLGDLGVEGGNELLSLYKDDITNIDYVQMSHHGQGGVDQEVYKVINPTYTLWPTPDWLWNDEQKIYKIHETKSWLNELNVKEYYVADNGTIKIDL